MWWGHDDTLAISIYLPNFIILILKSFLKNMQEILDQRQYSRGNLKCAVNFLHFPACLVILLQCNASYIIEKIPIKS